MQGTLFDDIEPIGITYPNAANTANVSAATIRNWVKSGYLHCVKKGIIAKYSLDSFMTNVAGKEKLTSRANKSLKSNNDTRNGFENFESLLNTSPDDQIGNHYQESLTESHRNKEGIYYTPEEIVSDMLCGISLTEQTTFLDPCCGSGNFIVEAIRMGVNPNNIYGIDLDPNAVAITKKRIKKLCGIDSPNIIVGDFFVHAQRLKKDGVRFDSIFTNPPWGKKLSASEKKLIGSRYDLKQISDTSSLFLFASFELLKQGGTLGFLVQEAFFNIASFQNARAALFSKKIISLTDYARPFKGLLTRAQAVVVQNIISDTQNSTIKCVYNNKATHRSKSSFCKNPKLVLNFWATEEQSQVIEQLYNIPHTTLKDKAQWGLGIVTGNNSKHCSSTKQDNMLPIYRGNDISKIGLKQASTFITTNFSNLQQVAPMELYHAEEKIIYRFISSDLVFFYDNQQRLILNSANLLIPNNIGVETKKLVQLLNSEIINWLFRQLFNTHKVLRGDLEELPLHLDYFKHYQVFNEKDYLDYLQIEKTDDGTYRAQTTNN